MARSGRSSFFFVLAALLGPACGGKTNHEQAVVPDSGPSSSGTMNGGDKCAPGTKPLACSRFPEGDPECAMHPAAALAFACADIRAVPRGCVNRASDCINCIDWCCPHGTEDATEFIATDGTGSVPAAPPPPGCERMEQDDGTCIAQDKPSHAYQCPTRPSSADGSLGYEVQAPFECIGNPYAGHSCGVGDRQGHVCCP